MKYLEKVVCDNGASIVELNSVNDDRHKKFYGDLGFYPVNNFVMMGKFME